MKAVFYEEYDSPDVLELREIETPAPKDDEVLIKVVAASVTPLDWHFLTGKPYIARLMAGLLKPRYRVLGVDVAGRVEAVGPDFKQFQPGDEVFGLSFVSGAFAEYVCVPASEIRWFTSRRTYRSSKRLPCLMWDIRPLSAFVTWERSNRGRRF
jgi:NADPH:quinone reductase-like Zn-dependent oxidoreductase